MDDPNSISDSIFFPSEISWSQSLGCFYQHSGIINTYQDGPFTYGYSIPVFLQPPASSSFSFFLQFQRPMGRMVRFIAGTAAFIMLFSHCCGKINDRRNVRNEAIRARGFSPSLKRKQQE